MAEITTEINSFLQSHHAQAIYPVPEALPNQRGPSCGFYALAYVLTYWHDRFKLHGGDYGTQEPLPPRTNLGKPRQSTDKESELQRKELRSKQTLKGNYTSLRHFGKYNQLTVLGSVFDAENLVTVARGENSQYAGQFDGRVVEVGVDTFSARIKSLLEWECPVIVPYDVSVKPSTSGEPTSDRGESAHWVAIIGYYTDGADDYAVYFNWGSFYTAKLQDFAVSNSQLTSNNYVTFRKYKITTKSGRVLYSEWDQPGESIKSELDHRQNRYDRTNKRKLNLIEGSTQHNPEFNDPTEGGTTKGRLDKKDERNRTLVGGLRNKVVVVFRKEDSADIQGVLRS